MGYYVGDEQRTDITINLDIPTRKVIDPGVGVIARKWIWGGRRRIYTHLPRISGLLYFMLIFKNRMISPVSPLLRVP